MTKWEIPQNDFCGDQLYATIMYLDPKYCFNKVFSQQT